MSEFAEGTVEEKQSFWGNLPDVTGYMDQKLPTMDKSLDTYFDKNMEAIIEEWGLLVENDMRELERRVNTGHHRDRPVIQPQRYHQRTGDKPRRGYHETGGQVR